MQISFAKIWTQPCQLNRNFRNKGMPVFDINRRIYFDYKTNIMLI